MNEITLNGQQYVLKEFGDFTNAGMTPVLIRSYDSGVHFGLLKQEQHTPAGIIVDLVQSRRVHYWSGAASLSQLAIDGIQNPDDSRIAKPLPFIRIGRVCEIIPTSPNLFVTLQNLPEWSV